MPCYKCKQTERKVYGVLQGHYCCQMCAAICVVKEIKTQLSLTQEQDARPSSMQVQDSTRQPFEDSSVHESANGEKSNIELLYEASLLNKESTTSAVVAETSNPRQRGSDSVELRQLIRRIPAMEATIIDHVLQAEEICQRMKGLCTLNLDFRKSDEWKYGTSTEAKSAKDPCSKAICIARMLRKTRDLCSADLDFVFYAFSYLELK